MSETFLNIDILSYFFDSVPKHILKLFVSDKFKQVLRI